MSLYRRNAKRDANEPQIVDTLEKMGIKVWRLSAEGVPDLLCRFEDRYFLVEVKSEQGSLTPAQEKFFDDAEAHGAPAFVFSSLEGVLEAMNRRLH